MEKVAGSALALLLAGLLAGCAQPVKVPIGVQEADTPRLLVEFSWSPAEPRAGQPVTFLPTIRSYEADDRLAGALWRFGDGSQSSDHRPVHRFALEGDYTVELTVGTEKAGQATVRHMLSIAAAPASSSAVDYNSAPAADVAPPAIHANVTRNVVQFSYALEAPATDVEWEFGDGATSGEAAPTHTYVSKGDFTVSLRVLAEAGILTASTTVSITEVPFLPHVVVGVPDSGFNVYHEAYRRPELTAHPCTYIVGYPCDIPALELTLDAPTWDAAFAADKAKWEAVKPGDRYWIPGTNIIGAVCSEPYQGSNVGSTNPLGGPDYCILDDTEMHGTGTSSSVLSENPDALLVVVEGNSGGDGFLTDGFYPIDVVSFSWGAAVPLVGLGITAPAYTPFYVAASGNEGAFPVVLDGPKSEPTVITVGGGDGASRTEPGYSSWKTADFVSEYCRPTAQTRVLSGERENYCGTSFSAPTFAGALSRVILELRRQSGYTGGIQDGMVDPILGVSKWEVREAINHTASYEPDSPFPEDSDGVPVLEAAPFYQWGWGYFARNEVPETVECILEGVCPQKDDLAVAYMEALWAYRTATDVP